MKSKVKPETLKLGDKLYFVVESALSKGVQEATVTTLSLDDKGNVSFKTNNILSSYDINGWGIYVTRSEAKAKKVYDNLLEQQKRRKIRYDKEKEIYQENTKNIDEVSKNYVGKTVMVRFTRYGKEVSHYEKVKINKLYPRYNKDEYSFDTQPETNHYLTTREGKNWYFWTELDELKKQKESIDKRIKELESEK